MFSMLEAGNPAVGDSVVAQRKLLYIEKLFAALLLAAPRIRLQLEDKIRRLQSATDEASTNHLAVLVGLRNLLNFYLPAVFRLGYLVRTCTWDGRASGSAVKAREVMEQSLLLLTSLLPDTACKNEYVRTLCVALATWMPWMDTLPAVCFVEESCEALISRLSHRCDVYRTLQSFDDTFNLYLTLPQPSRQQKRTRGHLRAELVRVFSSRIRRLVFGGATLVFAPAVSAGKLHSTFTSEFPAHLGLPEPLPQAPAVEPVLNVLRRAIMVLVRTGNVSPAMQQHLDDHVPRKRPSTMNAYEQALRGLLDKVPSAAPRRQPRKGKAVVTQLPLINI